MLAKKLYFSTSWMPRVPVPSRLPVASNLFVGQISEFTGMTSHHLFTLTSTALGGTWRTSHKLAGARLGSGPGCTCHVFCRQDCREASTCEV